MSEMVHEVLLMSQLPFTLNLSWCLAPSCSKIHTLAGSRWQHVIKSDHVGHFEDQIITCRAVYINFAKGGDLGGRGRKFSGGGS